MMEANEEKKKQKERIGKLFEKFSKGKKETKPDFQVEGMMNEFAY